MTPEQVERILTWRREKRTLYASAHDAGHRIDEVLPRLQMVLDRTDGAGVRGWCGLCGQVVRADAILPCRVPATIGGVR